MKNEVMFIKIYKYLDPIGVKNCSKACIGWIEIVAHYIFQPNLQELAIDESRSLSLKLNTEKKCLPYDCVDNNLFIAICEEFKFFKGNGKLNRFRKRINFQMLLLYRLYFAF